MLDLFIEYPIKCLMFLKKIIEYKLNFINNMIDCIQFKYFVYKNNIDLSKIINVPKKNKEKYIVGILLAAGTSSRFMNIISNNNVPKQLFTIKDKPLIEHSIDLLLNNVDKIIVVTNSVCCDKILETINKIDQNKICVLTNDINCRLKSIEVCLDYLNDLNINISNLIIHDCARPYIKETDLKELISQSELYDYVQFNLKLVNGLAEVNSEKYDVVDRDKYVELCTPLCCNYYLFNYLFKNFIKKPPYYFCEILPLLNKFNIKYKMLQGKSANFKKITYFDDIDND